MTRKFTGSPCELREGKEKMEGQKRGEKLVQEQEGERMEIYGKRGEEINVGKEVADRERERRE